MNNKLMKYKNHIDTSIELIKKWKNPNEEILNILRQINLQIKDLEEMKKFSINRIHLIIIFLENLKESSNYYTKLQICNEVYLIRKIWRLNYE